MSQRGLPYGVNATGCKLLIFRFCWPNIAYRNHLLIAFKTSMQETYILDL